MCVSFILVALKSMINWLSHSLHFSRIWISLTTHIKRPNYMHNKRLAKRIFISKLEFLVELKKKSLFFECCWKIRFLFLRSFAVESKLNAWKRKYGFADKPGASHCDDLCYVFRSVWICSVGAELFIAIYILLRKLSKKFTMLTNVLFY